MIGSILIFAMLTAVPPLSDADRAQLDTATDGSARNDEAALYPLLRNALKWETGDESGARVPNYDAMGDDPASHRGEVFLIEGVFARQRPIKLARSGSWGGHVTEWVVKVRDDPEEVAVIYFVDPDGALAAPWPGTRVRIPARFYKIWSNVDLSNQPTDYLLYVGRFATIESDVAQTGPLWLIVTVLVVLGLLWMLLRIASRARSPKPLGTRRTIEEASSTVKPDADQQGLPDEPADALDELSRRHDTDPDA